MKKIIAALIMLNGLILLFMQNALETLSEKILHVADKKKHRKKLPDKKHTADNK